VHLTPREQERLLLAAAADLARRRLARGARLGATEAVALVCDEVCELAWDGVPIDEVVERAGTLLGPEHLLDGVADLVPAVQVEALFGHGTSLVHVPAPFGPGAGHAGAVRPAEGVVALAPGRERVRLRLRNTGARTVWISSHYPLDELNRAVTVTPDGVRGLRLDLPAGQALAVAPGEEREVVAVRLGGAAGDGTPTARDREVAR
jgi:urease subunit gamma/beta